MVFDFFVFSYFFGLLIVCFVAHEFGHWVVAWGLGLDPVLGWDSRGPFVDFVGVGGWREGWVLMGGVLGGMVPLLLVAPWGLSVWLFFGVLFLYLVGCWSDFVLLEGLE